MPTSNGPNLHKLINALAGDLFASDFRAFLQMIDALVQCAVISKTLATPPGSPANGDRYIVAASPTGAWTGQTNKIMIWTTDDPGFPSGFWQVYAPNAGFLVYNVADSTFYFYTGSAWSALAGGGGATAFTGLSDVPGSYSGAGGKAVEVNAGASALVFNAKTIDIGVTVPGVGVNNQILIRFKMTRAVTFPASAPLSQASASTAATASTTYTLKKNGASFATVNYAIAATAGIWTQASDAIFAAGDLLEIDGPATADATLADVGITLAGVRS